jgi:hypothetical protein
MSCTMLCTAMRSETSAPKIAARPPPLRMSSATAAASAIRSR